MNTLMNAALVLASNGRPVFPVGRNKNPLVKKWGQVATTDVDRVRRMFSMSGAELIGLPAGTANAVDILDIDPRNGGDVWLAENRHLLPMTRVHRTRSGGLHYLFRHADGVRNSAGRIGQGIDIRGEGGFFVCPPSPGWTVEVVAPIATWPSWLLRPGLALEPPEPSRPISSAPVEPISDKRAAAYVDSLLRNLGRAKDGEKHYVLLRMGRALGGVAAAAGITDSDAVERLVAALPDTVKDYAAARETAAWALAKGRKSTIRLPDREMGAPR
jgi:hypothetical protein